MPAVHCLQSTVAAAPQRKQVQAVDMMPTYTTSFKLELPMDASLRTDCKNYLLAQNGGFSRQMAVYRLQFSLKFQ